MRIQDGHLDRRQGLNALMKGFAICSIMFFLIFIVYILTVGWHEKPPDLDTSYQKDNRSEVIYSIEKESLNNNQKEKLTDVSIVKDDAFFKNQIEDNLRYPEINPEIIRDLLWEYAEYNKSKKDILSIIDTSIYISKIYITYDEKIDDALEMAMTEMECTKTLIQELDNEQKIKYELENLSMLSSIYHLMGIKNVRERNEYYQKASVCMEELLSKTNPTDEHYSIWLLDLVNIEDERGNREGAIKILSEWEKAHMGADKELYFKYILILLDDEGNEADIERIIGIIEAMEGAKEDYRYEKIIQNAYEYLGKERDDK